MKAHYLLLILATTLFAEPSSAKTLTLGIDMSESNPSVVSDEAAAAAGALAYREITALQLGDFVHVRRFGERGAKNMPSQQLQITRRVRAPAVASSVKEYITQLPSKSTQRDNQTNILAFLELGSGFDCANGGRIVLFTDGIEASKTISDKSLLSGKPLPPPTPGFLKGCEVVMFGVGQSADGSLPPSAARHLRNAWADWMKVAGATFTAITDF